VFVRKGSEEDDVIDDDDEASHHQATDAETSYTRHRTRLQRRRQQLQQQPHQRDDVAKKRQQQRRRRIVEVIDSSTEEDQDDVVNNNHLPPTPTGKPDRNNIPHSSLVSTNDVAQKQTFPSSISKWENSPDSLEFTDGSRQPKLIKSRLSKSGKRAEAAQSADCTRFGRTALIESVRPSLVNRSDQSIPLKTLFCGKSAESFSKVGNCNSEQTSHSVVLSNNAVRVANSAALANDIATFSLAFDDFLSSEEDEDFTNQATEYTQVKFPEDWSHSVEKPSGNLPDVVISSQVTGTVKEIVSKAGSDQSSSAPQPGSVTGSGQGGLIGSQRPGSEAARLREERLQLSRLKKAEFQRKYLASGTTVLTSDQH